MNRSKILPNLPSRILAIASEIIDDTHFRGAWQGQHYEGRALPGTSQMSVGDAVFCNVLPGNSEVVAIYPPAAGRIYYGIPAQAVGGNNQADFYHFDGTTHTKFYTTTLHAGESYFSIMPTLVFYHPDDGQVYYLVHCEYDDGSTFYEEIHMFKVNPSSHAVSEISVTFDSESDVGWEWQPPIGAVAYFKGTIYLAQWGSDNGPSGDFPARVYSFDETVPSVTKEYTHPATTNTDHKPSLAVYGSDSKLHFCCSAGGVGMGKIYESADGSSFSELQNLGDTYWIHDLMTDRSDNSVYAFIRKPPANPYQLLRYAGVSYAVDVTLTGTAWLQGNFGAQYTQALGRTYVWAFSGQRIGAGNTAAYKNGAAWTEEANVPAAVTWFLYTGTGQPAASLNDIIYLILLSDDVARQLRMYKREAGAWSKEKEFGYNASHHWGIYDCMALCLTEVLPHEQ